MTSCNLQYPTEPRHNAELRHSDIDRNQYLRKTYLRIGKRAEGVSDEEIQ
jgi:hypothetical protein